MSKITNNKPGTPRKGNTTNKVTELKAIVESLQSKVTTLGKKVGTLENKVEALESTLLASQNTSDKLSEELSEIPVKRTETCKDLKHSFEKNVIKDMEQNSKEEFDFEYDKIHRHRKVNSTKQNVIVRFRLH